MSEIYQRTGTRSVPENLTDGEVIRQPTILNQVSWGAVFAGVVVALVVQVLLTILGIGIGIARLSPRANTDVFTFSITAGIWYVLTGIVAAYIGGYVAARMSGKTNPTTGALHGLTAWAFTTLVVLYLLTSTIGSLVGGAFSGLASAAGGIGQTVAQTAAPVVAASNPLETLEMQIRASGNDPQAMTTAAVSAMRSLVTGREQDANAARKQAAQALATARGIPLDQATQQVAQLEKDYRDRVALLKQQTADAADTAAHGASRAALSAFVALVLGAIAGWLGGRSGVMNPVYADRLVGRQ